MNKVLDEMKEINNREASFKTSIALILEGEKHFFHVLSIDDVLDVRELF